MAAQVADARPEPGRQVQRCLMAQDTLPGLSVRSTPGQIDAEFRLDGPPLRLALEK